MQEYISLDYLMKKIKEFPPGSKTFKRSQRFYFRRKYRSTSGTHWRLREDGGRFGGVCKNAKIIRLPSGNHKIHAYQKNSKVLNNLKANCRKSLTRKFTRITQVTGRHLGNCIISGIRNWVIEESRSIKGQPDYLLVYYQQNTTKTQHIRMDCYRKQHNLVENLKSRAIITKQRRSRKPPKFTTKNRTWFNPSRISTDLELLKDRGVSWCLHLLVIVYNVTAKMLGRMRIIQGLVQILLRVWTIGAVYFVNNRLFSWLKGELVLNISEMFVISNCVVVVVVRQNLVY